MGIASLRHLLRRSRPRLVHEWARVAASNGRALVLADRANDLLDGIAEWLAGRVIRADEAFARVVDSPSLQQLRYDVGLETLLREGGQLRLVLLRELVHASSGDDLGEQIMRLDQAIDRAIGRFTTAYALRREELRDRFIAILGHDLRDPIEAVAITARILAGHDELRPQAAIILQACDRMSRMVSDVLDFARGHLGGGIPAVPVPNDMGEIVRVVVDQLAASHPERPIKIELEGDLHGPFDRERVLQAIANLISNAIAHGVGPIEVAARRVDDEVVTAVTSHGAPIPPERMRRIFEPFAADGGGLGLGLYIVEQIALAHGGHCSVTSSKDATRFEIRWPRSTSAARRRAS